jgi:hypothetical protein
MRRTALIMFGFVAAIPAAAQDWMRLKGQRARCRCSTAATQRHAIPVVTPQGLGDSLPVSRGEQRSAAPPGRNTGVYCTLM